MEKNKTAVEWLFEKLWDEPKDKFTWYALRKKALEMEKDQIIESFDIACQDEDRIGKEYYNEIYGKKFNK